MRKRVNITLPEETIHLIDRVAEKGDRSRLIDEAVRHFVRVRVRQSLRKRLQEGAQRRAERDLRFAEEWLALEGGPWPKGGG